MVITKQEKQLAELRRSLVHAGRTERLHRAVIENAIRWRKRPTDARRVVLERAIDELLVGRQGPKETA